MIGWAGCCMDNPLVIYDLRAEDVTEPMVLSAFQYGAV